MSSLRFQKKIPSGALITLTERKHDGKRLIEQEPRLIPMRYEILAKYTLSVKPDPDLTINLKASKKLTGTLTLAVNQSVFNLHVTTQAPTSMGIDHRHMPEYTASTYLIPRGPVPRVGLHKIMEQAKSTAKLGRDGMEMNVLFFGFLMQSHNVIMHKVCDTEAPSVQHHETIEDFARHLRLNPQTLPEMP